MTYLPVPLGVRQRLDVKGAALKGRAPSKAQIEKTLARDSYTCCCCGFESKKYQRVIPLKVLSPSAKEAELVAICTFCEMATSLDVAGLAGAGYLIWLPELTQPELNHVVRALYVARESQDTLAKAAQRTLEVLMSRRAEAKKRLGTDDPLLLATAFYEQVDEKTYAARAEKIEGLRFLPLDRYLVKQRSGQDANIFPQMLAYWASPEGPLGAVPVDQWGALLQETTEKLGA